MFTYLNVKNVYSVRKSRSDSTTEVTHVEESSDDDEEEVVSGNILAKRPTKGPSSKDSSRTTPSMIGSTMIQVQKSRGIVLVEQNNIISFFS